MMRVSIREANLQDYEELCEVIAEADDLHREAIPRMFRAPEGPARPKEYVRSIITNENAILMVAQSEEEIVGLVKVDVRQAPDIPLMVPRRYATIGTLVVRRRYRRLGVGRALMEAAQRWAQGQGASEVELTVWEFNTAAIDFYEELGYETVNRTMWRALRTDG
jgi:ribosomal protein S18 acetylase RimI-like enzyme